MYQGGSFMKRTIYSEEFKVQDVQCEHLHIFGIMELDYYLEKV